MNKFIAVLAVCAALPAAAADFDAGVDVSAAMSAAREQRPMTAADAPAHASGNNPLYGPRTPNFTISDARRTELVLRTSEWRARKENVRLALNAFYDGVYWKDPRHDFWRKTIRQTWGLAKQIEWVQDTVADRFSARINAQVADPAERSRRLSAIATSREFRKFVIYGNLIPRVIDEGHENENGLSDGRIYAGPTWGIVMTWDEGMAVNDAVIELTGFSQAEYHAADDAAGAEYKVAHPEDF
jgi:hypothetical protein